MRLKISNKIKELYVEQVFAVLEVYMNIAQILINLKLDHKLKFQQKIF